MRTPMERSPQRSNGPAHSQRAAQQSLAPLKLDFSTLGSDSARIGGVKHDVDSPPHFQVARGTSSFGKGHRKGSTGDTLAVEITVQA